MSHVCGVRTAGLAIAQATLASLIVLVSFSWGIFFFKERVKNLASACTAVFLIVGGICGMSHYSSSNKKGGGSKSTEMVELKKVASDTTLTDDEEEAEVTTDPLINDVEKKHEPIPRKHKPGFEANVIHFSEYINKRYNLRTTPRIIGLCCSGFGGVWGGTQICRVEHIQNEVNICAI